MHGDGDWLNALKVGDEVITCSGYYGKSLNAIARTTKAQVFTKGGSGYWRKNGRLVGSANEWMSSYITEPTPALKREIRRTSLVNYFQKVNWAKLTDEQLEAINSLLAHATPTDTGGK